MWKLAALAVITAGSSPATLRAGPGDPCADLQQLIQRTYNFKPSKLPDAGRTSAAAEMDKVWKAVKSNPKELVPCLRASLEQPKADPWFLFDGSKLLVSLDPSAASKAIQVRAYTNVDLDDVNLQVWVETLTQRGVEGFDVSEAGAKWLAYPKAKYYLAAHGGFPVGALEGGLFLFGSMDEARATEPLIKIANQQGHPGREQALWILESQATPESFEALRRMDTSGLSKKASETLQRVLEKPPVIEPTAKPTVSREQFLGVFDAAAKMDWARVDKIKARINEIDRAASEGKDTSANTRPEAIEQWSQAMKPWNDFIDLLWGGKPTERDAVAVLQPEDLLVLRKLRRRMIAPCNQHAIQRYIDLTQILFTFVWKPDLAGPAPNRPPAVGSDTQEAHKQAEGDDTAGDAGRVAVPAADQQEKLIQRVTPVYPPLARQARIQGTVVLQAVFATDGTVKELKVLSGPPLLLQAAMDAVRQWRFRPTQLGGKPVEVETKIEVIFALQ